jgi:hypothetical protein
MDNLMATKPKQTRTRQKAESISAKTGIDLSTFDTPEEFLFHIMNSSGQEVHHRTDCAKALLAAKVRREGMASVRRNQGLGKKQILDQQADEIASGKSGGKWGGLIPTLN